jgi:predicted enzyme related to lactoylglutathione lyase
MSEASNLGRIAWYQLVTKDTESAQKFYAAVVGWDGGDDPQAQPSTQETGSAWSELGSAQALVTMDKDENLAPHWRAYFSVPCVDSACQRAIMGGGEVYIESTEIPGVGKVAVLSDILGAVFAVVEPCEGLPDYSDGPVDDGQFCWSELGTENYTLAFRFYEGIFHWSPGRAVNIPQGRTYQMFKHGEREIGGILDLKRDEDVPPHWMHYIRVPSVESAIERAEANGGTVIIGAHQVPDGAKTACLSDPQGAIFSVWSPPGS